MTEETLTTPTNTSSTEVNNELLEQNISMVKSMGVEGEDQIRQILHQTNNDLQVRLIDR